MTESISPCQAALDAPPPVDVPRRVILVAAVALLNAEGQVLITERPKGKEFEGLWEFPGGKVEPGETPDLALMRELREELGIETRPTCYWPIGFVAHNHTKDSGEAVCYMVLLYQCRTWRGEVSPQEGQGVRWVKPAQLFNHPIIPSDLPLVTQVMDRLSA